MKQTHSHGMAATHTHTPRKHMCTSVNTNVVSHRCLKRLNAGRGLFDEGLRGREHTEEQFFHLRLLAGLSCCDMRIPKRDGSREALHVETWCPTFAPSSSVTTRIV